VIACALSPIFDTNIFGHVQSGKISQSDWKRVLRHRPGLGWPLSLVTALELLVDLDDAKEANFAEFRERIDIAFRLANGQILEDPRPLICKNLLRVPFPPDLVSPSAFVLSQHMNVIRRSRSLAALLSGMAKPKRNRPSGLHGTDAPKMLVEDIKRQWISRAKAIADDLYPEWRTCFEQTGWRLPEEMRKNLKYRQSFEARAMEMTGGLLDWLGAEKTPEVVAELKSRLDPVVRFTAFVVAEFLERNYSLEKHASDVFDQFQLHYLALDGYTIVTHDRHLLTRTTGSPQASRIMSFEAFLQSLS
jgi:hypothetical protein